MKIVKRIKVPLTKINLREKKFHNELFDYNKTKLNTNDETKLKVNKFFGS